MMKDDLSVVSTQQGPSSHFALFILLTSHRYLFPLYYFPSEMKLTKLYSSNLYSVGHGQIKVQIADKHFISSLCEFANFVINRLDLLCTLSELHLTTILLTFSSSLRVKGLTLGRRCELWRPLLCWSNPSSKVGLINPPKYHINTFMGHYRINPNLGWISYPLPQRVQCRWGTFPLGSHIHACSVGTCPALHHTGYTHSKRLMYVSLTHTQPCLRRSALKPQVTLHSPNNDTGHICSMRPCLCPCPRRLVLIQFVTPQSPTAQIHFACTPSELHLNTNRCKLLSLALREVNMAPNKLQLMSLS